jgi:deazaflavin-dependent oxidoreductase (nitroreductase family)
MTSAVERKVPPDALIKMSNPVLRVLLNSPLHAVLDSSVLLLHVTGRKTGRRYDIPVNYADIDGRLVVVTIAGWRANLRGGASVEVTLRGRRRPMRAELAEDPAAVAVSYQTLISRLGWDKARRHLGISVRDGRPPTVLELKDAAREYGWSVITLTPA